MVFSFNRLLILITSFDQPEKTYTNIEFVKCISTVWKEIELSSKLICINVDQSIYTMFDEEDETDLSEEKASDKIVTDTRSTNGNSKLNLSRQACLRTSNQNHTVGTHFLLISTIALVWKIRAIQFRKIANLVTFDIPPQANLTDRLSLEQSFRKDWRS